MIKLTNSLNAWNNAEFNSIFKNEIQSLDPALLPLQQGLSLSSYVGSNPISVVILNCSEKPDQLQIKTGIFYTGIIAGCSCSDDPTPVDEQNEYCEMQFNIDKKSAETCVSLLAE